MIFILQNKATNVAATVPEFFSPTSAATSKEAAETSPILVQSTGSTFNDNSGTSTSTIPPPMTSAAKLATPPEPTTPENEDGRELITPATFVNSDDNEAEVLLLLSLFVFFCYFAIIIQFFGL